jgi:hypothetical protein
MGVIGMYDIRIRRIQKHRRRENMRYSMGYSKDSMQGSAVAKPP